MPKNRTTRKLYLCLGFSVLMFNEKADKILQAVDEIARDPFPRGAHYNVDETTARFALSDT